MDSLIRNRETQEPGNPGTGKQRNRRTERLLPYCSFIFLFLTLMLSAAFLHAAQKPAPQAKQKSLSLITESLIQVPPEIAIVTVHFTAYGWSVEGARKKTDQLIKTFQKKLADEKIPVTEIKIGGYKLKPSYQFNRELKTMIPSDFLVSKKVICKFKDFDAIPKWMDATKSIGSFILESAVLTVEDPSRLRAQAMAKAIEDAKKKAGRLEESLSAKVEEVTGAEEISTLIQDVNLIQDTLFTENSANPLNPSRPSSFPSALHSNGKQTQDQVTAQSKVKVVFSLR